MKKVTLVFFFTLTLGTSFAQNTLAKFKYEDAAKAYLEQRYEDCISNLNEAKNILGQTSPKILHLTIMAQYKLWEGNPYESYEKLERLRANCNTYLKNYDILGMEEKYRDVYDIQNMLPKVTNQADLAKLQEKEKEKEKIEERDSLIESVISKNNLVLVEGGTYTMGKESDAHQVTLSDFYIGKYEVSIKEWNDYMKSIGGKTINGIKEDGALYTSTKVNIWEMYMGYCKWLEKKYGGTWRLPTEAEWEYAARGGNKSQGYQYSGSDRWQDVAQIIRGSYRPRGRFKPNELGIYDMTGNVYEVCYDYWSRKYYQESPSNNPMGPAEGKDRVARGGGGTLAETTVYDNNGKTGEGFLNKSGFRVVYIPNKK